MMNLRASLDAQHQRNNTLDVVGNKIHYMDECLEIE